jgi:hypothetical protein
MNALSVQFLLFCKATCNKPFVPERIDWDLQANVFPRLVTRLSQGKVQVRRGVVDIRVLET